MLTTGNRAAYITGVAESDLGEVWDQTELSMVADASLKALAEAGLSLQDVDAIFTNYMGEEGSVQVGEYLGIQPRWADSSDLGGAAFEAFVHHAATAIAQGRCEVALITYASRQRTRRQRGLIRSSEDMNIRAQFETPYGLPMPIGQYALMAARHMHEYGTTSEQLASVAVAANQWAQRNPKAWRRNPITIEDVLNSRMVSSPLHRLDCCLITDGGGAVVVTSRAAAESATKRPIRILGAGESHGHWHIDQMHDLTVTPGKLSSQAAFAQAGITAADIDVLQPYDSFTITVLLALEDLGICARGESGDFAVDGNLAPGGALPAMTSGGGLSYCHPGALGLLLIVEAVRQLRHECGARQVSGDPQIAVAHGVGGFHSTAATVVLGRD